MLILPKEREKIIGRDGDGAFKGNIQYPLQIFSSLPKSNNRSTLGHEHMAPTDPGHSHAWVCATSQA